MESQVQVPVASESTNKTNCSLRASAIRFRAPIASGLVPAEPPTMVQPLHRLGLSSLRCQHSGTGTSPAEHAIPCVRLQELPRRHRAKLLYPRSQHTRAIASTRHRHSAPVKHTATSTSPTEEGAPTTTGAPTSHRTRRDRRVAPEYQGQGRSIDHTAAATSCRARTYRLRSQNTT